MSKLAIVSVVIGDFYDKYSSVSLPMLENYAKTTKADLVLLKDQKSYLHPAYVKLECKNILDNYDRLVYVDGDTIVRKTCPNLFDLVPTTHVAMFDESQWFNRRTVVNRIFKKHGMTLREWNHKYYNTGVIVCPKEHKHIFHEDAVNWKEDGLYEQSYMNMIMLKTKVPVFDLDIKYNHMIRYMTAQYRKQDSYILHYAGIRGNMSVIDFAERVRGDLALWESSK